MLLLLMRDIVADFSNTVAMFRVKPNSRLDDYASTQKLPICRIFRADREKND